MKNVIYIKEQNVFDKLSRFPFKKEADQNRKFLHWSVCLPSYITLSLLTTAPTIAASAEYPERPITFVSGYAAGATNDYLTRFIARGVGESLGGTAIVENRTGANGIVGAGYVARAKPDGYTLLTANSASHGINPTLYAKLPYDALKDFQGVSIIATVPNAIVVNPTVSANNLKELIAYVKSQPSGLSFAASGIGSTGHLTAEAFAQAAGIRLTHIPYKGDAPAVMDTMAGQVQAAVVALSAVAPQLSSGKLKVLGITSAKRLTNFPDIPTVEEQGFPNFAFSQWFAIVAPAKTPPAIVNKLSNSMKKLLDSESTRKDFSAQGVEPVYTTPEETQNFIRAEIARFGAVIKKINLHAE